jgi:pSer/pThr/pTyr-binding forkhead associated (FHA) protein
VGRSPQCDIFLNDMTVSREHATIRPEAGEFVIKDSNSFNGIWINNQNVEEAVLEEGDIVQIGAFCLLFNK